MPRYFNLILALALVWLLPAVSADDIVRIDDILVLNGAALQFDPIGGFNATTSDPAWQSEYLKSLSLLEINEIYQKQHSTRDTGVNELDERQNGQTCV
jgi:hypothetical protein